MSKSGVKCLGLALVVSLGANVLLSGQLHAQVPTVEAAGKMQEGITRHAIAPQPGNSHLYTVPPGRRLILTDVFLTNGSSTEAMGAVLRRGMVEIVVNFIFVPPRQTFAHAFVTGIEYGPGDEVVVSVEGGGNPHYITIAGYLMKERASDFTTP
jgi:hypothetical protein